MLGFIAEVLSGLSGLGDTKAACSKRGGTWNAAYGKGAFHVAAGCNFPAGTVDPGTPAQQKLVCDSSGQFWNPTTKQCYATPQTVPQQKAACLSRGGKWAAGACASGQIYTAPGVTTGSGGAGTFDLSAYAAQLGIPEALLANVKRDKKTGAPILTTAAFKKLSAAGKAYYALLIQQVGLQQQLNQANCGPNLIFDPNTGQCIAQAADPAAMATCAQNGGQWVPPQGSNPGYCLPAAPSAYDQCINQGGRWGSTYPGGPPSCAFQNIDTRAQDCQAQGGQWNGQVCNFPQAQQPYQPQQLYYPPYQAPSQPYYDPNQQYQQQQYNPYPQQQYNPYAQQYAPQGGPVDIEPIPFDNGGGGGGGFDTSIPSDAAYGQGQYASPSMYSQQPSQSYQGADPMGSEASIAVADAIAGEDTGFGF